MNKTKATEIAKNLIRKAFMKKEIKILLSDTVEFQRGWVFFYNTEEFIKNPTSENGVFQSTPILIDKFDGIVYRLFDPIRRFTNKLDWLEDYILMKEYTPIQKVKLNYSELNYYELPTTDKLLNEKLMIHLANKIISEPIEDQEKNKIMDFLNRNLLDENIWKNVWIKERLKSRNKIRYIINKKDTLES